MKHITKFTVLAILFSMTSIGATAFTSMTNDSELKCLPVIKDSFLGGWAYTVQGAPEGYEKGFLLILKEDKTYKAQIQVGGSTFLAENIMVKKNTMTFDVMIEGQKVAVQLMVKGSKLTGTTTSNEGVFQITGEKTLSAG